MDSAKTDALVAALPKAELHLHLEGSIAPATAAALAARHGAPLTAEEVTAHYEYQDFDGFIEAFKWVTAYLRAPEDFGFIVDRLTDALLRQNVVYAEVTLSVGVMLLRKQNPEDNFASILQAGARARARGLRLEWIFDAARQFGPKDAMEVAEWAARCQQGDIIAFGLGGDELAFPASDFRPAYDLARKHGMRSVVHAGEIGGPEEIRAAIEDLGAERIGHGIAALHDPALMDFLTARRIPLENCIASNFCTGALAKQLGKREPQPLDHPLKMFFDRGVPVVLSTDDPAMFHTNLLSEYRHAAALGLGPRDIVRLARMSLEHSFLPPEEKVALLAKFQARANSLGLV
jgi:aminodeoxyfutalosine deaminase